MGLSYNKILTILPIVLILVIYFQHRNIKELKNENQSIHSLYTAIQDSISQYRNERGEWVTERMAIQSEIKNLEAINSSLSDRQKELVSRIKEINKKNSIIAAALIDARLKIDSLLVVGGSNGNEVVVDTLNNMVNFNNLASGDSLILFDIDVNHVRQVDSTQYPTLLFKTLVIPNKQFVEFHWKNDKKRGYPISFTVTNTNKYIKVDNVESYAIPPLNKIHLNPNRWERFENFMIVNGNFLIYFGVGALVGGGVCYALTR